MVNKSIKRKRVKDKIVKRKKASKRVSRRRSLTKFGKTATLITNPTNFQKPVKKPVLETRLQKLIDEEFPFVENKKIKILNPPKPISIPRNSEVFKKYLKNLKNKF